MLDVDHVFGPVRAKVASSHIRAILRVSGAYPALQAVGRNGRKLKQIGPSNFLDLQEIGFT